MKEYRLFFSWIAAFLFIFVATFGVEAQNKVQNRAHNPVEVKVELPELVAEVNGERIMKPELADECLRIHGETELADQVKKFLIKLECEKAGVIVTEQEINEEIVRMAKTFKFSSEEWLNLLSEERNISAEAYKSDILWPLLSIRKLAGSRLHVSEEEIQKEYDAQFGPAVKLRQIVLKSRADAEKIHAEVKANPESFPSVAKNQSLDPTSQAHGGLIQPLRLNTVNPAIEKAVFALKPMEISPIIEWPAGVFIIFRCDEHLQPQNVDRERVRDQLVMGIRDAKTRVISEEIFLELQRNAQIDAIFGNPVRMAQSPGVAALVNGRPITMAFLADVCLNRYGKEVLSDLICRRIVEQACRRQNIVITDADIDGEIREMAIKYVPLLPDGSPNVQLWMSRATRENRMSPQVYRTNTIWPVLALKRLSRPMVQVKEEDIQRSFEANFGKKIRCLAIAFGPNDQRRAQEVWAMANQRRTPENFGDLADKYSVDAESRLARGLIPSIGRYCGQPKLEEEAFKLLPNEISQIVQVDDHLVILYCLGYEEPTITDINEVKADIVADIFEKKQKAAVTAYYDVLYKNAAFDNYLTGESRNPQVEKAMQEAGSTIK